MNGVIYYSNTGESLRIATYVSQKSGYPLFNLKQLEINTFQNLFLVFPVHCQNIPDSVKQKIAALQCNNIVLLVTYGKICYGNVLYEAAQLVKGTVRGGAYIPCKHAYLKEDTLFSEFEKLDVVIDSIHSNKEVSIPRTYKNPFANFFPKRRSQIGVKLIKSADCTQCGICDKLCSSIHFGIPDSTCIRCLQCVDRCPQNAISFHLTPLMSIYLKTFKCSDLIIYI